MPWIAGRDSTDVGDLKGADLLNAAQDPVLVVFECSNAQGFIR
jgi:hypothetical protein